MIITFLLLACTPGVGPVLYVTPPPPEEPDCASTDLDGAASLQCGVQDRAEANPGEWPTPGVSNQCGTSFATGDPLFITWILPSGVPDPDVSASLRVETACTTETLSVAFTDGVAQTVLDAPDGAEAGVVVSVSAWDEGDTCTTATAAVDIAPCPEPATE